MAAAPVEIRGLVKRYGEIVAVDHVDLTVQAGDVYGYLGPNGAGKTTSLRMMLGLIVPTEGSVRLFGRDPQAGVAALEGVAGFVEAPRFYPYLTGRRNLELLAAFDGGDAAERLPEALETVELTARAKDKVGGYSHGMRQRLGIAAALLRDPKLLLLDEPATGLDPAGMRDMRALIRRLGDEGHTVILSSHMLGEVQQVCDRVGVISYGRMILESTVEELRGESELVLRASPYDVVRATLDDLGYVQVVSAADGELRLRVEEHLTGDVTRALVLAGVEVREVRRADRQLEDVFFEITTNEASNEAAKEASHV